MGLLEQPNMIAIIGMAGRFPGAHDIEQFRQNLENGVESITFFSDEELLAQGVPHAHLRAPNYVKAAPLLDDFDRFDAAFFDLAPREAELMDPQHRILLECAWEALESAGYAPRPAASVQRNQANHVPPSIGVFAGAGGLMSSYLLSETHFNPQLHGGTASRAHIGNDKDYVSTRISYKLDLQGPSLTVQTACSTSLVAVHLACQSLLNGECDMALAGGVNIRVPQRIGYLFHEGDIVSPDGHCRPFDAAGQGTIFGSGVGLVVLKPLEDAIRDRDVIDAVIRGSAINNDGGQKVSYWATRAEGQAGAISQALAVAEVEPETIGYVETHGTGTFLGDPVEIMALGKAFATDQQQFCAIGSVKSNIGHLETASGIAGLIKAVLSLKHKTFYPSLNFTTPNPRINFETSPFFVNTTLREWSAGTTPRRAAVNALGIGGTNAHIVLEEAPVLSDPDLTNDTVPPLRELPLHLLTLAAKTPAALQAMITNYHRHLAAQSTCVIADLCYTTNTGRVHFDHRLALPVADQASALAALAHAQRELADHTTPIQQRDSVNPEPPRIAFLFTGQGSQSVQMGRELYESEALFRQTIDRCDAFLQPELGRSIVELLFPDHDAMQEDHDATSAALIDQTAYTQPLLFAVEYALATLWQAWGIAPELVMGHSIGEYVAACVAGIFSLEDGLKLVAARGRLMQALPPTGAMVAIFATEEAVTDALAAHQAEQPTAPVAIAAINGPQNIVISGEQAAVQAIAQHFAQQGIRTQPLTVSHAFHSPLMNPMLADFARVATQVHFTPPQEAGRYPRLISNITGQVADATVASADYWVRHITAAVRFADGVQTVYRQGCNTLIEIGPKAILLGMARQISSEHTMASYLPSLRANRSDWQQMLNTLGDLYVRGATINWARFHEHGQRHSQRHKVPLPTYPFQRKRFWLEGSPHPQLDGMPPAQPAPSRRSPLIDRVIALPRQQQVVCETEFSVARLPFMADHHFFGQIVAPGACQLAMVLEAAQLAYPQRALQLADVVLPQPLFLDKRTAATMAERTVQVLLQTEAPSAQGEPAIAFELVSFHADEAPDTLQIHATGKLMPRDTTAGAVDLAALQRRCPTALAVEQLHRHAAAQQVYYGPHFHWLTAIWTGVGEAIGRLQLPPVVPPHHGYACHPALLASCMWLTDAIGLATEAAPTQGEIALPFALTSLMQLHEITGQEWWCHVQQVDEAQWQIQLLDDGGTVLVQIEGYSKRAASPQFLVGHEPWRTWLYEVSWQPQRNHLLASIVDGTPATPVQPDHWLILADRSGVGSQIHAQLQRMGYQCTVVYLNTTVQIEDNDDSEFAELVEARAAYPELVEGYATSTNSPTGSQYLSAHLVSDHPELTIANTHAAFQQLVRELVNRANSAGHALRGILHCCSVDGTIDENAGPEALAHATEESCRSALYLTQALLAAEITTNLWLITQGAQPVAESESELAQASVPQATLWGLGKVIAAEHPELHCRLVDLDPRTHANEGTTQIEALLELFIAEQDGITQNAETQLAFRQGQWYVPRLLSLAADQLPRPMDTLPAAYQDDATYLIVGGTRGIGLKIAQWMVAKGAKQLVLVGRHQPDAAAQATIDQLATPDVHIQTVQADVAQQAQIAHVLTMIAQTMPPLRGIIHAAGVVDDRLIQHHEWALFHKVFAPKVQGAWNLHHLTKHVPLDFFVLFSSTASQLGIAGLANYAAANAFLDAFAHYRHALGLPALSINWGAWQEIGMAAAVGKQREQQWAAMGLPPMMAEEALAAFGTLLQSGQPQVGIYPVIWPKFLAFHQTSAHLSFFEAFRTAPSTQMATVALNNGVNSANMGAGTTAHSVHSFQEELAATPPAHREARLASYIYGMVIQLLGVDPDTPLERRQGFFELGMDSLMTLEFKNRLQISLALTLPATVLFKYTTIGALIDYLAETLGINAVTSTATHHDEKRTPAHTPSNMNALENTNTPEAQPQETVSDELDAATADKLARLESLLKEL